VLIAVPRAARSRFVSVCGAESGAFVKSSKNGVGQPSPRNHQPRSFDARRAKTASDGGGAAFGGRGPTAERSKMRHRGRPSTSSPEWPLAPWLMKEWMSPTTGKRGPAAVLPIGVRQQSVYQRKTLLEKRRHRTASVPAVSFTRPVGIRKMSVPPAASSTSGRSRKRANAWQSLQ